MRDVEVLQHKLLVLVVAVFGLFEWRVRVRGCGGAGRRTVFPLVCAAGGAALLTHSHAIANVKDPLLIEITHTPLALFGVAAGWARWLELRLDRARHAHRRLGVAGVFRHGRAGAAGLPRGVGRRRLWHAAAFGVG